MILSLPKQTKWKKTNDLEIKFSKHTTKKLGIKNDYAPTLKTGKELNKNEQYDLIFLDINLPDGNGLNIIPELKQTNDQVYIVVISAYNVEDDKKKAFKLGADHFMGKPFNGQQVEALLKN